MKKILSGFLAILFGVSLASVSVADDTITVDLYTRGGTLIASEEVERINIGSYLQQKRSQGLVARPQFDQPQQMKAMEAEKAQPQGK
ncbi:MAG: hypothetical protein R3257_08070 [bacterium]|nr:hypothetical protein [bacterium]